MAKSIIHAKPSYAAIKQAIRISLSDSAYVKGTAVVNPYGDGSTSKKIIDKLLAITARKTKTFFDL